MHPFKKMIFSLKYTTLFSPQLIYYDVSASGVGQGFQLYDVTNSVPIVDTNNANALGEYAYVNGNTYRVSVFAFVDAGFTALANATVETRSTLTNALVDSFYDSETSVAEGTSVLVEYTFVATSGNYYTITGAAISGEM
jgi:hypothetical protein